MNKKPKTQLQLVDDFLAGEKEGVCGGGGNLKILNSQLVHYNTVIAERYGEKVILNYTRYSIVTGRIQKMIKEKVSEENLICIGKIQEGYRKSLAELLEKKEVPADVG